MVKKTQKLRKYKKGGSEEDDIRAAKLKALTSSDFRQKMLSVICKDSNICIDFGKKSEFIMRYFGFFTPQPLSNLNSSKVIGTPSQNGVAIEVELKKEGYKSYACLKIACSDESDNLMYEYMVGQFINRYVNIYPCFTITYNMLKIGFYDYKLLMREISVGNPINLKQYSLNPGIPVNYKKICFRPAENSLLIQYFPDFKVIQNEAKLNFINTIKEMPGILYQLYFGLERIKDYYTHYDFHAGNAGFYKPFTNKYLIMNYHLEDGSIIKIPTIYIAKIIDYGRSHFKFPTKPDQNTQNFMKLACQFKECKPNCGEDLGLAVIQGYPNEPADIPTSSFHWINPLFKNNSHDLRLLHICKDILIPIYGSIDTFFKDIKYLNSYGTPEDLTPYDKTTGIIKNVSDVRKCFEEFLPEWNESQNIEQYYISQNLTKAGEFHIYTDNREYEYIETR